MFFAGAVAGVEDRVRRKSQPEIKSKCFIRGVNDINRDSVDSLRRYICI